jgi:hypothetical protein
MPVDLEEVSATRKQSIARVELFTGADLPPAAWRLEVNFEDALYDGDGQIKPNTQVANTRVVQRRFGDIKDVSVTAAGATVTIEQLAALISKAAYTFRQQDIDVAKAAESKES